MNSQFDELAALYENMASWPFRKELEIPTVLNLIGDFSGLKVLDFGCGNGMYSCWIKAKGAARVIGYDESSGMLDYARRRAETNHLDLEFRSELTPDLNGQFDLVLAVYVLPYVHTFDELASICRAMARMLRPGGRLITLPIHPDYVAGKSYYEHYGFRLLSDDPYAEGGTVQLDLCMQPYDVHVSAVYWSAQALEKALHQAGFRSIQWKQHQVTPEGLAEHGKTFWDNYLSKPHAAIIDCRLG